MHQKKKRVVTQVTALRCALFFGGGRNGIAALTNNTLRMLNAHSVIKAERPSSVNRIVNKNTKIMQKMR